MGLEFFDSHCHLNDTKAYPEPAQVVAEAKADGVTRMIVIGVDPESSRIAVELADAYEGVYATVGWHPNYTASFSDAGFEMIRTMLSHPKVVGLGEIGLDNHWDYADKSQQLDALNRQLALAVEADMPLVFHCREAEDELLTILDSQPRLSGVLHCFGGDASQAARALELGLYLGVDGPITYKKNDAMRSMFANLPLERILIETDAPWMSPMPFRGKPNHPRHVAIVAQGLADAMDRSLEEVATATSENAKRLFRIRGA